MAEFSYRGRDGSGGLVTGQIDAGNAEGVAAQLMAKGVTPVSIEPASGGVSFQMPEISFSRGVDLEELILFSRQLYSLSKAGVVLNRAIRGLADSTRNARFREVLRDVETSLNTGINLSSSLRRHKDVFSSLYVNIVQVGENSGRLEEVFLQLSGYLEKEKDTRRRIMTAIRYPIMVLGFIGAALVVLNIFVIPQFATLFEKFNAELPLPTRILIGTSNFFVNYWWLLIIMVIGLILGIKAWLRTESGELFWDRYKLRIPIIGSILERSMLARYGRGFALMLRSGVPLINALELCAQAVGNRYLEFQIRDMRRGVERGESLLRTSTSSGMFTPLVLQMIAVGEETGQVDDLLDEMAAFYEQEVDYDVKNLSSYIEPVLIAAIAGLVAILALGIFLPMWDMMSVMQG